MSVTTDFDARHPARWLAVLRIVVGFWFLKGVVTKLGWSLLWGVIPFPHASERWIATMPQLLARYAAENPVVPYREFIESVVLANPVPFANLTAFGEAAVGIGLTLGVATVLAAGAGLLLALLYGLATQHMTPGQQGFHLLLVACMLAFLFSRAGRTWGLDALLRQRWNWWRRLS